MAEEEAENKPIWAIVSLMGHNKYAGKLYEPGQYGGLWRIDIPVGDSFRSKFFGSQAVFEIDIVSEQIARASSSQAERIIEYNAPILTRAEHEAITDSMRERIRSLEQRIYALGSGVKSILEEEESETE